MEEPDIQIRIATPGDMDEIMSLALMACEENGFLDPNPQKFAIEMWPALQRDHGICALIGDQSERIEGFVVLRVGTMWYSDVPVVEEKVIFVHPDYRNAKGGRATKLCEFSKKVADSLGMPLLIGVLSNHRTSAKIRMYKRQFGEPAGAFFLYGARTDEGLGSLQAVEAG